MKRAPAQPRPSSPILLLLTLGLVAGCSPEDARKPAAPPAAIAELPPPQAAIAGRMRKLPPWGDALRAAIDPRADGWTSEVTALEVEARLRPAIEALLGGGPQGERALEPLLAPDFRGSTELVAAERRSVFDDGTLRVEEPRDALPLDPAAPAALAGQLARWRASLDGLGFLSLYLNVERVEALAADSVLTRITLRVAARAGGRTQQQNLVWNATWRTRPDGSEARLAALVLGGCQIVDAARPVFRELTQDVFGGLACWKEELLRGAPDYHLRQDRLSRQPFLGMHGLAIGDLDGDGREDAYLAQPGGQPNRLFLRQADGGVKDGSHAASLALLDNTGPVVVADFDGDGDQDLALGLGAHILLRWNDGQGRLAQGDVLQAPDEPEITSMGAADVDNDGDLDLYACRYVAGGVVGGVPVPYYNAQNGARDLFWRNEGGHRFTEALEEVGLAQHTLRYGLALYFEDFDEDGWVDLYVVNDFGRNCLYKNERGRFRDVAPALGLEDQAAGMGADMADVDGDGRLDLYVTNMHSPAGTRIASQPRFMSTHPELRPDYERHARGNTLLRALPDGRFEDVTLQAGVAPAGWAWGARFLDFSNDGWPDLFVPNGFASTRRAEDLDSLFWREVIALSPPEPPATEAYDHGWDGLRHLTMFEGYSWNGWERKYAYVNLGGGRFADVSAATGLDFLDDSRAVATIDWDDDGRLDLLVRNRSGPRLRLLLASQPTTNHFLSLALSSPRGNRDAIGAQVYVEAGGRKLRQSVHVSQGFMVASSRRLVFALGPATKVERIEVRWPDGQREEFRDVAVDARYRVVQGLGKLEPRPREVGPGLDGKPGAFVEGKMGLQPRIVLQDKLPARALGLPRFTGGPRHVADSAGRTLLVAVGAWSDPRTRAWLGRVAGRETELAAAGAERAIVLLDEGAELESARKGLEGLGLLAQAGAAQKGFRLVLEALLIEVLGPFDRLDQPLELLFDKGGQLVAVYSAPEDLEALLQDVKTTGYLDPKDRGTEVLLGGDWARFVARSLDQLAQIFQALDMRELARFYSECARARR